MGEAHWEKGKEVKLETMETQQISIKKIKRNDGQIPGVPKNPRKWANEDVDRLARSIKETPELIEARPILVAKVGKDYIALGGNMRLEAMKRLGRDKCPCFVFEGLSADKMKQIALKDNSSFGEWDTDELANNVWSDLDLDEWGVRGIAGVEVAGYSEANQEIDTDEWSENMKMKFKFLPEQMEAVRKHFDKKDHRVELLKLVGYGE